MSDECKGTASGSSADLGQLCTYSNLDAPVKMTRLSIHAALIALCLLAFVVSSASAVAPTIAKTGVSKVTTDSALLQAEINPGGKGTLYRFEYGPDDCELSACIQVPVPEGELEGVSSPQLVTFPLNGLTPGTTYHLRVVASNADDTVEGPDRTFSTYVPALEGLPDGRAYEQASPVRKNAADARGLVAWAKASPDGNRVGFLSTSGIPGGVGGQELPTYLASRGASGWSTQGLLPPPSLGGEAFVRGWLPDFSTVFDFTADFGGEGDGTFVARSSEDATITPLIGHGQGLPNTFDSINYAGASADGSRVLFEARSKLACCDKAVAGKSNVYLWDRASQKISLISVLNDEESLPSGAFAGPYNWMQTAALPLTANFGGSKSNYYTQDLHTISASGNAVYFTAAGSGELYVRLNPTAAQSPVDVAGKCASPALACTLNLSAPYLSPPDPLAPRPAAFMAASSDGSTAFFASPEELTEDANTGPPQPEPALGSANISVEPPVLKASVPIAAGGIAVDAEHIYWANPSANAIGRSDLNGDNPNPNFITIPALKVCPQGKTCPPDEEEEVAANPQYVAVDAGHVYWTNAGEGRPGEGTIGRAELVGGNPTNSEAEWIKGASRPQGIAVDSEYIYWANAGKIPIAIKEGTIGRAEISGENPNQKFIPGNSTFSPQGLAVDGAHIYWSIVDGGNGSIRMTELDGSDEKFVFIGTGVELRGVAVDAGHVYWASQGEEAIGRSDLSLSEGSVQKEFIEVDGKPKGLARDSGATLYWSANGEVVPNPGNDLYRYRVAGEVLEDLTPDPGDVNGAEVKGILGASEDGKRVYLAANGDLDGGGLASVGDCKGSFTVGLSFSGQCSLYLLEENGPGTWSTSFIARLDASGGSEQTDAANWMGKGGAEAVGASPYEKSALTSADGSTLLFRSQRQLTDYDNEGKPEIYRFEVGEGGPSCISCNPSGEGPVFAPRLGSIGLTALILEEPAYALSRNLSADGNRAFFESADRLVVEDTNGNDGCKTEGSAAFGSPSCQDVYEWEAEGTGSCRADVQEGGCLYLLSTGTSPHASFFLDASLDGSNAFIATRSAGLVRQDQDHLQDVFDTRIGGGLESQNKVPPPPCESLDGCLGVQSPPPDFASPASASLVAPASKKQARHPAKKHKHKKHRRKNKRAAKTTGRGSR